MAALYASLPTHLDVLITHGPPLGYHDLCDGAFRFGSGDLLLAVKRTKPTSVQYSYAALSTELSFTISFHIITQIPRLWTYSRG